MLHYDGLLRQGQSGRGLGDVFRVLARTLAPHVLKMGKNFVKQKAVTLGPKMLTAGMGVMKDMAGGKRTFKQALRQRGKTLLADAINIGADTNTPHKPRRSRTGNKSTAQTAAKKKPPRKKPPPRRRDIFD